MINVDIVVPSYNSYYELIKLIESFKKQEKIHINNIVVPITRSNFGNDFNLEKYCKENKIKYFFVSKDEFSHSLTRQKAIFDYCTSDIVILLTQDVKLHNSLSMFNLVKDLNNEVVYSFGRQICLDNKSIERYIRDYNYPPFSYIATKDMINKYQIKAFFASDTFAGLKRGTFIKLGGYNGIDVLTNEDMLYMHELLKNGYKAKYCADAVAEHYHKYSYKELYKRYFNVGRFFKKVKIFNTYNKIGSGKKLSFYVLKEAFKHFDLLSIIKWLPNMGIRYIAMKRGSK